MPIPILSIYIPTFNHEKYIAQALDSVLMQQTQYPIETLVGEDCSTDNTREILKKYEQKYPGKFQMFYRAYNMNNERIRNGLDLELRCRGKYVVALEGDDYWLDPLKIEKQISFLENHPEYYAVSHNCLVVDDNSQPNGELYPECKDEEYTYKHFFSDILPGQTTTLMYRNYRKDTEFNLDYPEIPKGTPGDRVKYFMLLVNKKRIFCMQEIMSAYRHVTNGGSSFNATYKFNLEKVSLWYKAMLYFTERYRPEWLNNVKILYLQALVGALRMRLISFRQFYTCYRADGLNAVFVDYLLYKFRKKILKQSICV